jgi:hypothetical protein
MGAGTSSLYAGEDVTYDSNVVYPRQVESSLSDSEIEANVKTLDHADEALRRAVDGLTLDQYQAHYKRDKTKFDLFDKYFQDAALLFTHSKSREELLNWLNGADEALAWLVRARSIAIGTRFDVDWRGEPQFDAAFTERRATELRERWRESRLFHWQLDAKNNDTVWNEIKLHLSHAAADRARRPAPLEVVAVSLLDALVRVAEESSSSSAASSTTTPLRIAWVTKSTAHICGGNFTNPGTLRWRSEHALATLTDAAATISLRAEHVSSPHDALRYRPACHIPLGGALTARAKLLFVRKQPDTTVLLVPFPRKQFGGTPEAKAALASELLRAMAGVVKSALAVGVNILVLPSGGANQTAEEAYTFGALWGRVLKPTRLHFERIVIAGGDQLPPDAFKALAQGVRSTASGSSQTELPPRLASRPSDAEVAELKRQQVAQLVADTKAQVEQERASAEEQARLAELEAMERERAAAAERAIAERAARAKTARDRFRVQLRSAMAAHEAKQFQKAVDLYADGLEALGEAFTLETDAATKEDLRLQFDRYIRIAEAAKAEAKRIESENDP